MPDQGAVFDALLHLLAAQGTGRNPPLVPATRLDALPDLDSIRLIETIALLEERFAVEVATHELDALETLADIVAMIATGRPETAPAAPFGDR